MDLVGIVAQDRTSYQNPRNPWVFLDPKVDLGEQARGTENVREVTFATYVNSYIDMCIILY